METIINYTIGILGLILAYYFYKKSIRKKEPVYSIKSVNVISYYSSKYENLTVAYKGETVENFTVSKVLFCNHGGETIDRQDIATRNQLRILAMDSNILDARVLQVNNPSSDFSVKMDRAIGAVLIDFDYLNTKQGAIIEIIHTGTTSEHLIVAGDIKGAENLIRVDPKKLIVPRPLNVSDKRLVGSIGLLTVTFWYFLVFSPGDIYAAVHESNLIFGLIMFAIVVGGAIGTITVIALIISLFVTQYKLPRGLEVFNE